MGRVLCRAQGWGTALGKVGSVPGGGRRGGRAALPPVPLLSLWRSKASTGAAEAGAGDSCEEPEQSLVLELQVQTL